MLSWIFFGILAGIFTGLIPGVHVNLVAAILLGVGVSGDAVVFLIAMAVTHSFIDCVPSILLGAPDSAMALGVLPGHKLLIEGRGQEAIILTILGSLFGLILCVVLIPLWLVLIHLYLLAQSYLKWLLLLACLWVALRSRRIAGIVIFVISGVLGMLVLRKEVVLEPLFPMLSGLFGISILIFSVLTKSSVPHQLPTWPHLKLSEWCKTLSGGCISGFIVSVLPGLGSAQAAALTMSFLSKLKSEAVLVLLGSINTVNFVLSIITWAVLDKARNGAVVAAASLVEISNYLAFQLVLVAVVAGCIATLVGFWFAHALPSRIARVPYRVLVSLVIILIAVLVFWRCSFRGLLVLAVSTLIGLLAESLNVSKSVLMSSILLPVTVFFWTI